jgi:hypothetical protein
MPTTRCPFCGKDAILGQVCCFMQSHYKELWDVGFVPSSDFQKTLEGNLSRTWREVITETVHGLAVLEEVRTPTGTKWQAITREELFNTPREALQATLQDKSTKRDIVAALLVLQESYVERYTAILKKLDGEPKS